ncbi:MAG: NAD-specific glutamate dehydrogenase [uncultured Candidatus Poseidoniales archaeon]|nr:MAG: NAD-specific glutamate dehydrogenase [uncultured Candidatus Poseidoniales archaeon]
MHCFLNFLDLGLNGCVIDGVNVQRLTVFVLNHLFEFIEVSLDRIGFGIIQFVSRFIEGSASLVDNLVSHVPKFDLGLAELIFFCELLCFFNLGLNFVFRERGLCFNLDRLLFASAHVFCTDIDDSVCIDVEGHFDLRRTTRCGRDAHQGEFTKGHVVLSEVSLTLEDVNCHRWLVITRCRVNFRAAGRDGGVAFDHGCHDATKGLNAQGEWGHVKQKNVRDAFVSSDDSCLQCSTHSHCFVWVDAFVWRFSGFLFHGFLNRWNSG